MATVAAAQLLIIGPARILPWVFLATIFAVLQNTWWAVLLPLSLYGAAVAFSLKRPSRESRWPRERAPALGASAGRTRHDWRA